MLRFIRILFETSRAAFGSRTDLVIENLALRQQLAALSERPRRPRLSNAERLFWVVLSKTWEHWADALAFVRPETVLRWHRRAFRCSLDLPGWSPRSRECG